MATRFLTRSLLASTKQSFIASFSRSFSYSTPQSLHTPSFSLLRLRPLVAAAANCRQVALGISVRSFATRRTSSSLNDPNPNWSNRPPKETILLDGCDFEHWLVVMEKPEGEPTRDEIIDSYIKTLAKVVGSEEEARMKIYSVSTRHYFAFGALVSEELSYKLKELDKVRWVLPDSYLDVRNKDYGGEPFINGQAVPYDPKYHEEWVRNNARANERNRRNDRPRNFDRSRNYERRREMQINPGPPGPPPNMGNAPNTGMQSTGGAPNMGAPLNVGNVPPNNMSGPPNMGFPPNNMSGPPPNNMSGKPNTGNMAPNYGPSNMGSGPPNMPPNNMGGPPNTGGMPQNNFSRPPNNMTGPPNMQGNNMGAQQPYNGGAASGNFGGRPYNAAGPGNAPTFQHGNAPGNYGGGPYQSTPGQHQNNYAPNSSGGYPYQNPNLNQNQNIPGRDMPPSSNSQ